MKALLLIAILLMPDICLGYITKARVGPRGFTSNYSMITDVKINIVAKTIIVTVTCYKDAAARAARKRYARITKHKLNFADVAGTVASLTKAKLEQALIDNDPTFTGGTKG